MSFRRPWYFLPVLLALSQLNACTHGDESMIDESLEPSSAVAPAASDEEVNFDGGQPTSQGPEDEAPVGETPPDDPSNPDFIDPSEVGLSPNMEAKPSTGKDDEAALAPEGSDAVAIENFDDSDLMKENIQSPAIQENTLVSVSFAKNSSRVKKKYRLPLKEVAQQLKADKQLRVHLSGHADARGSSHYNKKLSLKRAKAVKQALVKLGVKGKQIKLEGFGKERLLAVGDSEQEHSQNRRVELTVK